MAMWVITRWYIHTYLGTATSPLKPHGFEWGPKTQPRCHFMIAAKTNMWPTSNNHREDAYILHSYLYLFIFIVRFIFIFMVIFIFIYSIYIYIISYHMILYYIISYHIISYYITYYIYTYIKNTYIYILMYTLNTK